MLHFFPHSRHYLLSANYIAKLYPCKSKLKARCALATVALCEHWRSEIVQRFLFVADVVEGPCIALFPSLLVDTIASRPLPAKYRIMAARWLYRLASWFNLITREGESSAESGRASVESAFRLRGHRVARDRNSPSTPRLFPLEFVLRLPSCQCNTRVGKVSVGGFVSGHCLWLYRRFFAYASCAGCAKTDRIEGLCRVSFRRWFPMDISDKVSV